MTKFALTTDTQDPGLETAMEAVYQWNYGSEVEELRRLYIKAAENQWISERDLDWDREIDHELFQTTPLGFGIPFEKCSYCQSLHEDVRWEVMRRTASFRLSNFLHGEQGALLVASQLVNCVPHTDAKFYAATQTMDEARHVEVFARYIEKLDEVQPVAKPLKQILDATLSTGDWLEKLVGMQIVIEGLALHSFKEMRNLTQEPLLKDLLTYVARDEARHHAYGVLYVSQAVPLLTKEKRESLEDFALSCASALVDRRNDATLATEVFALWQAAGVDLEALLESVRKEVPAGPSLDEKGNRKFGAIQGFVIPTLKRLNLFGERVARDFHQVLAANLQRNLAGDTYEEFITNLPDLPEDTSRWALEEIGSTAPH
jgi:rubrerythrin